MLVFIKPVMVQCKNGVQQRVAGDVVEEFGIAADIVAMLMREGYIGEVDEPKPCEKKVVKPETKAKPKKKTAKKKVKIEHK